MLYFYPLKCHLIIERNLSIIELALLALVLLFAFLALAQAFQLSQAKARILALEMEVVKARSAMVLAQAREWEIHRESGKHQGMD